MWDFSVGRALSLLLRTLPFILLRLAVYLGMTVAYLLAIAIGAGLGWGIGGLGSDEFRTGATVVGGLVGFGIVAIVAWLAREYILYLVKAAHIAVLVEILDGRPLPDGNGQIAHGQAIVRARFVEASVLFGVDQVIKGVLRAITGLIRGIFSLIPVQAIRQLVSIAEAFMRMAVGFIDEVILAHGIRTRSNNPWQSARTALVLYGQNYRVMLKNAAWLLAITWGLALVAFLLLLAPAAGIAWLFPGVLSGIGVIVALFLAWSLKAALLEPFAMVCMMEFYFRTTEGQKPDPAWEEQLDRLSAKFRRLGERAMSWAPRRPAPGMPGGQPAV
jgi:hypothetical protein